jgi:hypothetical protein
MDENGPDMGVEHQMDAEDFESVLQLLGDFKHLIRDARLGPDDKLSAIDQAIDEAIGDMPEAARDFVRDVMLGRLEP